MSGEKLADTGDAFLEARVGDVQIVVSRNDVQWLDGEIGSNFTFGHAFHRHVAIGGFPARESVSDERSPDSNADSQDQRLDRSFSHYVSAYCCSHPPLRRRGFTRNGP